MQSVNSIFECDDASLNSAVTQANQWLAQESSDQEHLLSSIAAFPEDHNIPYSMAQQLDASLLFGDDKRAKAIAQKAIDAAINVEPHRAHHIGGLFSIIALHDSLFWQRNPEWIRANLPKLRPLLKPIVTFVETKRTEASPSDSESIDFNAQTLLANLLALLASDHLEFRLGDSLLSKRYKNCIKVLKPYIIKRFYSSKAHLIADEAEKETFSLTTQLLALITGLLLKSPRKLNDAQVSLFNGPFNRPISPAEQFYRLDILKAYKDHRTIWNCLKAHTQDDVSKFPHFNYFLQTGILGIRPASIHFESVRIEPNPFELKYIRSHCPHPNGSIDVNLSFENDGNATGQIKLPEKTSGTFIFASKTIPLKPGENSIRSNAI